MTASKGPTGPSAARPTRVEVRREGYGPVRFEVDAAPDHRKRRGLFFTPWPVALALGRLVRGHLEGGVRGGGAGPLRVCDPFVGAGALLAAWIEALVEPLLPLERPAARREALAGVYGVDIEAEVLPEAERTLWGAGRDEPPPSARRRFRALDTLLSPPGVGSTWERAFPEVAERGGFDLLVANPPWEKVRVNERELFERFEPGFAARPRAWRDARRRELLARPEVAAARAAYHERIGALKAAARRDYATSGSGGDLDTYKLAVERCVDLARPGGLVGLIVPHGLLGDWGARKLRRWLFEHHAVLDVVRIETGPDLFAEIHANLGVLLLVIRKKGCEAAPVASLAGGGFEPMRLTAAVTTRQELEAPAFIEVPADTVAAMTPHAMVPLLEERADLAFLEQCARFPRLGAWGDDRLKPRREVDMTNDRGAFRAIGQGVPLLEGKHLSPWRLEPARRRFDVEPGAAAWSDVDRIAWRAVADRAMKRRLVAAWVPRGVGLGNSLIFSARGGAHDDRPSGTDDLLWLLAFLNSRVADAQLRLWCANNNINMFHLKSCRAPLPERVDESSRREVIGLAAALTVGAMGSEAPGRVLDRVGWADGAAGERVDRLDELWRRIFGLETRLWERCVWRRTAPAR